MHADFSGVRVHRDIQANLSAAALGARAFTVRQDIAFAAGEFRPETAKGDRLLAHELAHVIQHGSELRVHRQLFPPAPIVIRPPAREPLVVNAIDDRVEPGPWWYLPRYGGPLLGLAGDVSMTSTADMVQNIIRFLDGRKMQRLNINDHGDEEGVEFGSDFVTAQNIPTHAPTLRRLKSTFAPGAIVHIQSCSSGQSRALICGLAEAFGVPVYAGTGLQEGTLGNFGNYVRCDPNGTFHPDVGRPPTPPAPPSTPDMA